MSQQIASVWAQVTLHRSIMLIELPPKVWIPKLVNKYIPPDYADNIDEGIFYFARYGKSVYRPRGNWEEGESTNLITFDDSKHVEELRKNIIVSTKFTPELQELVIPIVKKCRDCFFKEGAK